MMIGKILIIGMLAQGGGPTPEEPVREPLTLRINLPEYRLEVWDGGDRIRTYDATIGAPGYSTPSGVWDVTRIVWNPWWNPPNSKWARGKKRTAPGPHNPMGRAKIQFDRLLYIHGSTQVDQLGQARSHGCIRLANEDVLELARLIAEHTAAMERDHVARLEANPKSTYDLELPAPVRLEVRYRLVKEVDGEVRRYEDVYDRGLTPAEEEILDRQPEGRKDGTGPAVLDPAA